MVTCVPFLRLTQWVVVIHHVWNFGWGSEKKRASRCPCIKRFISILIALTLCPNILLHYGSWRNNVHITHPNWSPLSMFKAPAPAPKPYPLIPNLRPWQFLQYNSFSCSVQLVESKGLLHKPAKTNGTRIHNRINYILKGERKDGSSLFSIHRKRDSQKLPNSKHIYDPFRLISSYSKVR